MAIPLNADRAAALPRAPANLALAEVRERLTPASAKGIVRLAGIWRLTGAEACGMLGGISPRTWFRIKGGNDTAAWSQDQLTRASLMVGIFKGLRLLFSENLADEWIKLPNRDPIFAGNRPLDVMIEGGIPKMVDVRRHVDALRGGL